MAFSILSSLVAAAALFSTAAHAAPLEERQSASAYAAITPAQWAAFNTTIGGRLALGVPMSRPCYALTSGESPLAPAVVTSPSCTQVENDYTNDSAIVTYYGGYLTNQWQTCQKASTATPQQCLLTFTFGSNMAPSLHGPAGTTCYQGSVSQYFVNTTTSTIAADAAAAFTFVKQYKIPLSIKNTGHDYKGRSTAPNSLGFWTHNVQYTSISQNFIPAGCKAPAAVGKVGVTFGAGNGFDSLYRFADANGVTVVGGSSRTVGAAGGWTGGGGHSSLSNTLGLGADRALQIKVVLPSGKLVTTSRCQNADLFFALRGGGGSTFGIMTEVTTAAAPKLTLQVAYVRFVSADPNSVSKFLQIIIANSLKWASEGWGGYIEPAAMTTQASGFVLLTPKLTTAQAALSMKPITDYVGSLAAGNVVLNNQVSQSNSFLDAYETYILPNAELVDVGIAVASRFIPKANFANATSQAQLLNAMVAGVKTVPSVLSSPGLVYGGAPIQILVTAPTNFPGDGTSSVTPAWRDTVWHVIYGATFDASVSNTAAITAAYSSADTAANYLRAITPPGAYQNEASIHEPNHAASFWGMPNYQRLFALKKYYDPNGLLSCWHCIGWLASDATTKNQYSCYP